jgi:excinuclease ABC subunit B
LRQQDDMITDQAAAYLKDNKDQTHMQILKQHDKTIEARAQNHIDTIKEKHKPAAKTLFVSATPATYELELSSKVVEQIIRPT